MIPIQEIAAHLIQVAFKEDATAYELLQISLAFSFLWAIAFAIARPLLRMVTYGKPWLRKACEREYNRGAKEYFEENNIGKEDALGWMMGNWASDQVVAIQHIAGAMLCIPSVFGIGDSVAASSLAVMGILSELGWELQHFVELIYKRVTKGKVEVPNSLIFFILFHHSLTCLLGLPIVLHYRTVKAVHWLCFDLQIAGGTMMLTEYAKLLDIKKASDLRQFKVINLILLISMVWTRCLHWTYNIIQVMVIWYNDKAWTFLAVGCVPLTLFTFFNAMACVLPMYKRFIKFLHKSADVESLPSDASEKMKTQSMMDLEDAIDELILEDANADMQTNLVTALDARVNAFMESLEGREKLVRRKTMPPLRKRGTWSSARMIRGLSVPASAWKED